MIKYKIKEQYNNFKDKSKKNIKYRFLINYILSQNSKLNPLSISSVVAKAKMTNNLLRNHLLHNKTLINIIHSILFIIIKKLKLNIFLIKKFQKNLTKMIFTLEISKKLKIQTLKYLMILKKIIINLKKIKVLKKINFKIIAIDKKLKQQRKILK